MRTKFHIARVIHQFLTGLHTKQEWQNGVTELRTDGCCAGRHLGHKSLLICCQKVWQRPSNSPVGHTQLLRLWSLYPGTLISFPHPLPFSYQNTHNIVSLSNACLCYPKNGSSPPQLFSKEKESRFQWMWQMCYGQSRTVIRQGSRTDTQIQL